MPATSVRTALSEQQKSKRQQSWFAILKQSASEWADADAMTWAAAIACYTVLALAPMLVVAVKVATVFLRNQAHAIQTIQDNATKWLGPDGATAIGAILQKIVSQKSGWVAAIISGVLVIVSVGGVFSEVQQAMNRVWKLKPKPGQAMWAFIRARLKSVVVLGAAALLLLASVAVAQWLNHLTAQFGMGWKILSWTVDFVATLVALTLIFAMVFKTVPDAEIGWKSTVLGAVITAVLFALGKYGLALYFKFAAPTSAFGAVGSLAAVLIWIYYSAQIVLFGAVFTQVYSKDRGHGVRPSKHAQFLSECNETETATPSNEEPHNKPARPGSRRQPARAPAGASAGYASVLGGHAPSTARSLSATGGPVALDPAEARELTVIRSMVAAGAGVVFGALLGGYGATQARRPAAVARKPAAANPRQLADARLRRRIDAVEQKVTHASRVQRLLEADDVNERLDEIREQIRASRSRARVAAASARRRHNAGRDPWTAKLADAVKRYL